MSKALVFAKQPVVSADVKSMRDHVTIIRYCESQVFMCK